MTKEQLKEFQEAGWYYSVVGLKWINKNTGEQVADLRDYQINSPKG